jgi:hypothetical protein
MALPDAYLVAGDNTQLVFTVLKPDGTKRDLTGVNVKLRFSLAAGAVVERMTTPDPDQVGQTGVTRYVLTDADLPTTGWTSPTTLEAELLATDSLANEATGPRPRRLQFEVSKRLGVV